MFSKRLIRVSIAALALVGADCKSRQSKVSDAANLAKVLITDFYNKSQNPNHDYLVSSLTSAIESAMAERFSYKKFESFTPEQMRQILLSDKNLNERLQLAARENPADIIIFGWFETAEKNKIVIKSVAYIPENEEIISQFEKVVKVDPQIFETINVISQSTVAGISAYTAKIRSQAGEAPIPQGEKIDLTRRALGIQIFVPPIF